MTHCNSCKTPLTMSLGYNGFGRMGTPYFRCPKCNPKFMDRFSNNTQVFIMISLGAFLINTRYLFVSIAFSGYAEEMLTKLCDAYDAQQKEIKRLRERL